MTANLAHKAELAPHDKRRYRRVELVLTARFMLADQSEHDASLYNISAGGIALKCDFRPALGESIIVYVQDIGRLEGKVVRHLASGFALAYETGARQRERVIDKLTCKINPNAGFEPGDRLHARIATNALAHLIWADGFEAQCRVLDMSFGGVSLAVDPKPRIGEKIVVGRMRGRVVRHHDEGIGVAFDQVHQTHWGSLAQSLKRPSSDQTE